MVDELHIAPTHQPILREKKVCHPRGGTLEVSNERSCKKDISYFSPSHLFLFALLVLLPLGRNSDQPLGHIRARLFTTVHACLAILSRGGFSTFFPRRLASNCAYPYYNWRCRQLVSFEDRKLHTEIRTHDINAASGVRG